MTIQQTSAGVLVSGLECFSLHETLDCGQCFRFAPTADGAWRGVAANYPLTLRQCEDGVLFENIAMREFEEFWRAYFDLDRDYAAIRRGYLEHGALCECARFAPGIRVLRQNAWEALISFIISQNNNVKRIQGIVDRLCILFGEEIQAPWGSAFAFPTPQRLAQLQERDLAPLRCGWRDAYILDAARKVADGHVDLKAVAAMPLAQARQVLQTIRGVGPKVAECALLYGMGRMEAFPMDVWMKRAMRELFPGYTPSDFGDTAGIAQQYIFHYCRCHPDCCRPSADERVVRAEGGR